MDQVGAVNPDVDDDELIAAAEEIEEARELVQSARNRVYGGDPEAFVPSYLKVGYTKLTQADASLNSELKIRGVVRKDQTERLGERRE